MNTPEQDRVVRQFLPSVYRSQRLAKLKPYFMQVIILAQAASAICIAVVLAPVLKDTFDTYGMAVGLHGMGLSSVFIILLSIASKTVVTTIICAALIWWLGQQKKLLRP